jgi:hypothetical protein
MRHGADYSNDLGTSQAMRESFGERRGAEILSDGDNERERMTARRNPRPDNEDMHIFTSDESVARIVKHLECSRMEASKMLGGLKAYAKGFYDSRTLDNAIKDYKKGKKFVASELTKQQRGPDKEEFHLLDRAEAANAVSKETGCSVAKARAALDGKGDGIPGLPKYGGNYYKDTDLADWLEKHSQKIAVPDPAIKSA